MEEEEVDVEDGAAAHAADEQADGRRGQAAPEEEGRVPGESGRHLFRRLPLPLHPLQWHLLARMSPGE